MATKKPTSPKSEAPADTGSEAPQGTDTEQPAPKKRGKTNRGESKHSPRRIESVEKQAQALEYRKMGLSYSQIAQKLEMAGAQSAWYCVEAALQRVLKESAEDVRKLELERLDAMFIPVYGNACRGDLMALDKALAIMARRARMLGLDAPDRRELTGKDGKDLPAAVPTTILIGGAGEDGEPQIMGDSVAPAEEVAP